MRTLHDTIFLVCVLGLASVKGLEARASANCFSHQAGFTKLIGLSTEEVRSALLQLPGIKTIRLGTRDTAMTMDFHEHRATITSDAGRVKEITCG